MLRESEQLARGNKVYVVASRLARAETYCLSRQSLIPSPCHPRWRILISYRVTIDYHREKWCASLQDRISGAYYRKICDPENPPRHVVVARQRNVDEVTRLRARSRSSRFLGACVLAYFTRRYNRYSYNWRESVSAPASCSRDDVTSCASE